MVAPWSSVNLTFNLSIIRLNDKGINKRKERQMGFPKPRTGILGVVFFCSYLCSMDSLAVAGAVGTTNKPLFEPGKEYHIVTDNKAIGTQSFNLYVPRDYTDDRDWPVIFRYKGRGDKYNPIVCRGGRSATCDRGAIVIGMGYLKAVKRK
jgi:hypothetical protein